MGYIAVVGAANVDIGGFPSCPVVMGDSNPGRVRLSCGGVGRNIACNAARIGLNVELITALGGDSNADLLRADCGRFSVGLRHAITFADENTSSYLFICDSAGDMAMAVNDMAILERMTAERILGSMDVLAGADLIILEANLPEETSAYLAKHLPVPVLADAVSAAKAARLSGAIPYLDAIKPNRIEAEILTGIPISDAESACRAAEAIVKMGAKRVFLTLGQQGVCCADAHETVCLNAMMRPMKNATGAGDAFTAALAWARLQDLSLTDSARAGMAAASIAVESMSTVNPDMSEAMLLKRMNELQ